MHKDYGLRNSSLCHSLRRYSAAWPQRGSCGVPDGSVTSSSAGLPSPACDLHDGLAQEPAYLVRNLDKLKGTPKLATPRLRVLIADDHMATRAALRADLEEDGIEVCAEVGTGAHAVDAALSLRPDVCLIDIEMPGGGIVAAGTISRALPSVKVVLMTATPDENSALAAARAGAVGYLDKAKDPRWLPQVVRAVAAGQAEYPQRFIPGLLRAIRAADPGVHKPERPATLRFRKDLHALASSFRLGLAQRDLLRGEVPR
jgi:two-component system, NarL family, nitrate/nitrite response regulator NarL